MKFRDAAALSPRMGLTQNGMPTYTASGNPLVDLFSLLGSSRGKDLRGPFEAAYAFDRVRALKLLLWARDVRGGAGERQVVRLLLQHLEEQHPDDAEQLVSVVPEFGRWDDLLVFKTDRLQHAAFSVIAEGLRNKATAGIASKWMPRKGRTALALEQFLGLSPKAPGFAYTPSKAYPGKPYRKMLAELTNAVEQQMCARDWDAIVFDHVPSLAAARYQKAFNRRCAARYAEYKAGLETGERTIKAGAVYPYDVIKSIEHGDPVVAQAQWDALPNFMGDEPLLAMVDVSGSMLAPVSGESKVRAIDVSTSLGLYIADKARGPFKDTFLTFSGSPTLQVLTGNIVRKHQQMARSEWGMNTNLHGAFMTILQTGKQYGVADADMPRILVILSDMEFDSCVSDSNLTALAMAQQMYTAAGYTMPRVVFWNLRGRVGNAPVQAREGGTALISGFSPAVMKAVLRADDFTPEGVMEQTIGVPRYDVIDKERPAPLARDPISVRPPDPWQRQFGI